MPNLLRHARSWLALCLFIGPPAFAGDYQKPYMSFEIGGGQVRFDGSDSRPSASFGRMELGSPLAMTMPIYGAVVGETFRIYEFYPGANYPLRDPVDHSGRGLGLKLATFYERWHMWLGGSGGIMTVRHFADSDYEVATRYRYMAGFLGFSYAFYESDAAAMSFGAESAQVTPDNDWRLQHERDSFFIHHGNIAMRLISNF